MAKYFKSSRLLTSSLPQSPALCWLRACLSRKLWIREAGHCHSPDAAKEGFLLHALRGRRLWIRDREKVGWIYHQMHQIDYFQTTHLLVIHIQHTLEMLRCLSPPKREEVKMQERHCESFLWCNWSLKIHFSQKKKFYVKILNKITNRH